MIYLHIGLPRVMSTSIQQYFDANESFQLKYIGYKPKSPFPNKYADKLISEFLNIDLRFGDSRHFESHKTKYADYFDKLVQDFGNLFISCENISLNIEIFEPDILCKINRVLDVLPASQPVKIISCFRDVMEHLKSMYKAFVYIGYSESFDYFTNELLFYRAVSFLEYLYPHVIAQRLSPLLSQRVSLYMLFPEYSDMSVNSTSLNCINQIESVVNEDGIFMPSNQHVACQWTNKSLPSSQIYILSYLNKISGIPVTISSLHEKSRFAYSKDLSNCFDKLKILHKNRNLAKMFGSLLPFVPDIRIRSIQQFSEYCSLNYKFSQEYFSLNSLDNIRLLGDWRTCYGFLNHPEG